MDSPKYLNYETRPLKFTERKMLLASLTRVVNYFNNDYQYIGFGGITFTDFKLFHKELHIDEMYSIEGGKFSTEKLNFNAPFSFIKIHNKFSTEALENISFEKKSLIWLDYDGTLDNYFFNDIRTVFSKLPEGSIYLITCNRELKQKNSGSEYTTQQFREVFGDIAPFKLKNKDFSAQENHNTIRKMLTSHIQSVLDDRNTTTNETLIFNQLFNICYQENRGARMYTFGGVIIKSEFDTSKLNLSDFEFISNDETTYKLAIPNFTRKEIDLVDSHLLTNEEVLLNKEIVTTAELEKYKKTYKYLPNFFDVRV